ncbi:MAG: hypothetical protein CMI54_01125 [Parcubacteria group bacterium]|nr:hypothetical protein [Parcubacteria group bacterium]
MDPGTPAGGSIALSAQDAIFLRLKFSGGADGYTISKLIITRGGVAADADLADVKLWDGTTQLDSTQALDTNTHKATFSGMAFEVPAGETKVVKVTASIAASGTATVGDSAKLILKVASDITATKTIGGTFPISSNSMTIAGISVGDLDVAKQTPPATTTLLSGSVDQAIGGWKFTASTTEGFDVHKIVVTHVGSATANDVSNIKIKYLGEQIGSTVATLDSQNRAIFDLSADPLYIKAGSSKIVKAYADVASGIWTSRTVIFEITQYLDVTAYGANSGGATTVKTTVNSTTFQTYAKQTGNTMTIGQGTLTINIDSALNPATQNYVKGTEDRLFSAFKFTTGSREGVRIAKLRFKINNGSGGASDVSNVTLWDGLTQVAGPVGVVGNYATFGAQTPGWDSSGLFDVPASSNKTIQVKANIPTGAGTSATLDFDIAAVGDIWADGLDSQYDIPSGSITLTSGNANLHTVIANGTLSLALSAQTPSAQTYVIGAESKEFTRINLTAGSGEDIIVSGITLTINNNISNSDANATSGAKLINIKLLKSDDTQYGLTSATPIATASFNESLIIPASETITLRAFATVPTTSYPSPDTNVKINAVADVTATGVGSGATITPTGTVTGNTLTISSGTLTVAAAATPGDQTRIIGDTMVPFSGLVLTAGTAEDVRVTRVMLRTSSSGSIQPGDVSNIALYDGDTKLTASENLTTSSDSITASGFTHHSVEFIASDFLNSQGIDITKGQQKTITVKGDLPSTAIAAHLGSFGVSTTDDINTTGLFSNTDITETFTAGPASATGINYESAASPAAANIYEVTLSAAGTLATAAAADNPVTKIRAVGGEDSLLSNVEVLKVNFTASLEDIDIKQIIVERVLTASGLNPTVGTAIGESSDANVVSITLWDGLTQLGSAQTLSNASTTFNLPAANYWRIEKSTTKTLTVKANLSGVATNNGFGSKPGDAPTFKLHGIDVEGKSSGSNTLSVDGTADANPALIERGGNIQYLRKSKPTLTAASLDSTVLTTGEKVLFRWNVAADSGGAIGWKRVVFNITGTLAGNIIGATSTMLSGTGVSNTARNGVYTVTSGSGIGVTRSINQFKVWDVTENQQVTATTTDASGYNISTNNVGAIIRVDSDGSAGTNVIFVANTEQQVAAGASKTYELRGTILTSPSSGDSVLARIADLSVAGEATTTDYYHARLIRTAGAASATNGYVPGDTSLIDPYASTTGSFIWTDRSAPHLADSNTHSQNTTDWTNDYKVDGLPTATLSLSR